ITEAVHSQLAFQGGPMARKSRSLVFVTTTEANAALYRLSQIDHFIKTIENQFTEEVAALRKKADQEIAPLALEDAALKKSLKGFATANRSTLLPHGEKTVKLSFGSFGWRFTPFKVALAKGGEKKALATVKSLNLPHYVRVKESLDKEALLKDRPVIAGISYKQAERFFVEPKPAVDDIEASKNTVQLVTQ